MILRAMGHPVSPAAGFVIESFGMMARSAAFAVPGALGVQEGGFMLAAGLFGLSAEAAVALSMVKRLRELIVGTAGIAVWLWPKRNAAKSELSEPSQSVKTGQPEPFAIRSREA